MIRALVIAVAIAGCGGAAAAPEIREQTIPASGEWVSPDAEGAVAASERETSVGAIVGVVIDDATGRPVAMANVSAYLAGEVVRSDISTADGTFYIRDLPPATYRVVATRGGSDREFPSVAVFAGGETQLSVHFDDRRRIAIERGPATGTDRGALRGVVRDGIKGPGFPGAVVALSSDHLTESLMAMTDDAGAFHFPDLPPATYSVSCYYHLIDKGNVEVRRSNLVIEPGRTTRVELELDLKINR